MKKKLLFLVLSVLSIGQAMADPIQATPIESLSSYTGTDPYVFDMATRTYYAYNNLGEYEVFGLYPEVSTLKVAGGGVTEIEYIATLESEGTHPYINTNYIPKANTRIVMDVDIANSTEKNWMAVFGARQGGWTSHAFVLFARAWGNQTGCYNRTNDEHAADSDIPRDQRMTINAFERTCTFTLAGESAPTLTITTKNESTVEDCTNNLYLFDTNTAGAGGNSRDNSYVYMKLYGCKIYEGETLVKDYVPIVDAEGHGGLKDKLTGTILLSASTDYFALSPDGQALATDAGISVYPGKLVINTTDNHEYKWNGTAWEDLGSVYKSITDTSYQDMRLTSEGGGWECRHDDNNNYYHDTFDNIENNGNNNFFNPYTGQGGWEPYQCKVTGLTKHETYRVSFNFTSNGWHSWNDGLYSALPVFVTNNWTFNRSLVPTSVGGEVLGLVSLPKAAVSNRPYSFTFTADGTEAVLAVQFGVGNDNENFYFHFDDLNIEFVNYPEKYDITWVDPNKYTPLAYIESTDAARANAFTTPYIAKASTVIDTKFQSYGNGGWRAIFCGRGGNDNGISLYQNGNGNDFGYFVGGYTNDNFTSYPGHNQDITVEASLSGLVVNGGAKVLTNRTTFNASTNPISLFANPGGDNPFRGRIYYFTIKEGDETIYDFQPVMRHDGAFGYYDAATATFVTPAQGNWTGYGYKKLDDKAYMTYNLETRIVLVGNTAQFLPDVQNLDGATFTWTSSDETKATVAADGTVTGIAAGTVTITVTTDDDQGWTASYELTVSEPTYVRRDANNVGYAIVTGGTGWGDAPVANLVDNDATTKFGCSDASNSWAIIIASEPVAVQQYSFVTGGDTYSNPGRTPRSWKLEGSNDNHTWTVIDEQTQNYKAKTSSKEETVFSVNDTDTYKFFKFTATAFDGGFQLGEFWINEQSHTWGEPTETPSTCVAQGKKVRECSDCHTLKSEALPLAEHNYENNVCTVCNGSFSAPVLLENGQTNPYTVKFRHMDGSNNPVDVETGWNTADFDDSDWDEMLMPVGTTSVYHTRWLFEYNTFWFRRAFNLTNPSAIKKLTLKLQHDDDYKLYVNGTLVKEETGWNPVEIDVPTNLLVEDKNIVAIYIEQNFGGAYCDFSLEAELAESVTVSSAGYATYCSENALDFTSTDIKAYVGTKTGDKLTFTPINQVPANTGLLLVYNGEKTDNVPVIASASAVEGNCLVGVNEEKTINSEDYILNVVNGGAGFYKAGSFTTLGAHKAYIPAAVGGSVKGFTISLDDDATAIEMVNGQSSMVNGSIYNLAGQRLSKIQKGINIVNGKKILK